VALADDINSFITQYTPVNTGPNITPTAQAAAANTGIIMDTKPSMPNQSTLTPAQALSVYSQNRSWQPNGTPYNNDTTQTLEALALHYPGRGNYPDVDQYKGASNVPHVGAPPAPLQSYDTQLTKQMLGLSI